MKARADKLDLKIRALHPANPVYMAWTNRDQHSTMFANVIPTEQYNLKNEEFWCAASFLIEIRFIKFNLASRAYQSKLSPLEGLARPRALPRPPPYGAVERSARAWSPALQAGPVLIR